MRTMTCLSLFGLMSLTVAAQVQQLQPLPGPVPPPPAGAPAQPVPADEAPGEPPFKPVFTKNPVRFQGADFVLSGDLDAELLRTIGQDLDRIAGGMSDLLGLPPAPADAPPVEICLFLNPTGFKNALRQLGRAPTGDGLTHAVSEGRRLIAWAGDRQPDELRRMVQHEFAHQFLPRRILGRRFEGYGGLPYPKAFDEGVGEVMEQARVGPDGKADFSPVYPAHLAKIWSLLDAGTLSPARDVLSRDYETFMVRRSWNHAESWSLFHFLAAGGDGRYRPLLAALTTGLRRAARAEDGAPVEPGAVWSAALAAAGVDEAKFEAERAAFYRAMRPVVEPTPEERAEIGRKIAELGADAYEVRRAAADRLHAFGRRARPQLEEAVQSEDPEVRHQAASLLVDGDRLPRFHHWWSGIGDPEDGGEGEAPR